MPWSWRSRTPSAVLAEAHIVRPGAAVTWKLLGLPDHLSARLVAALDAGLLVPPYSSAAVRSVLAISQRAEDIVEGLCELERLGIVGSAAAAWLRTILEGASRTVRPDLVWSGPEVSGLHARDTRRVFEELLSSARHSVWASTYAFFDGPKAFQVLAQRMDAHPGIRVTLLLNIQRKRGDTTAAEQLVRNFADHFWSVDWPGSSRPSVYYDPRALELDGPTGVLHAKAVVVDDEIVLITSANLTEAAFDRNIELGLLVRDHALAANVSLHFRTLIAKEMLRPLPNA